MGRKNILWPFQATYERNLTRENLETLKKEKSQVRNGIYTDSHTKQRHKDQLCQNKNRQDATK